MLKHYLLFTAVVIALASCASPDDAKPNRDLMEASKQELATALEERDRLIGLVNEISRSMEQIKQLENMLTLTGSKATEDPRQRSRIVSDIAKLRDTLAIRRARLADLETSLRKSSISNDELLTTVRDLRTRLDEQAEEAARLRSILSMAGRQIRSLNSRVVDLTDSLSTSDRNLDSARTESLRLENQLYACYYIIAPKPELRRIGVIDYGFLRKTHLLSENFNAAAFTAADRRSLRSISLPSTSHIKILSSHPENSYRLTSEPDSAPSLMITDPDAFWSMTSHLIIQSNS